MADILKLADLNGAFSRTTPGLQLVWDSTSLGLLKTCPRKYFYTMIELWRSKKEAIPLTFGIHYHIAMETYAKLRAAGETHETATRNVLRLTLNRTWVPATLSDKDTIIPGHPWETGDTNRNRQNLIRSVLWHLDHFREDICQTVILANGKPATELSFKFEIPLTLAGESISLSGHLDKLVEFNSQRWVMDYKTTKWTLSSSYFDQYTPDNQMSLYSYASRIVFGEPARGVIIDAAQVAVDWTRHLRGFALRSEDQLDEWFRDTLITLRQAASYADANYWPTNDTSCAKYGGCVFRGICSKSPSVRSIFLAADFEEFVWDPTVAR